MSEPGLDKSLTADLAHRPRRLTEARLGHVVLQLLAPDRVADDLRQRPVAGAGAERRAQVGFVQAEEAGAELAFRRQADAVAVRAERLRDRAHEAHFAAP